nr:putative acetyltransferase [Quercus suber]
MGTRQRIQPPLPEKYFGNALLIGNVTTSAGNLLKHGLGWAALQINKVVASQTTEEGRPIAVRTGPSNKFDGSLTVFSGAEEGSMDFESCLLPETMLEDAEFLEALAS